MGRVASGVTGISLKDDDEVISGKVIGLIANDNDEIAIDKDNNSQVILITKNKEKKNVLIEEIRIQNRAGRGTNVMVINLDDEITETEFQ
jgi:topoisomerase-4 subunit A